MLHSITATAPAKAILFGEHAVNRGQSALAVSVGLYASCTLTYLPVAVSPNSVSASVSSSQLMPDNYRFTTPDHEHSTGRQALFEQEQRITAYLAHNDYHALQQLTADDFFAPAKYVLAAFGEALPAALHIHCRSQIPPSAGLGSGGAMFVALAAALAYIQRAGQVGSDNHALDQERVASLALRGDILAHGGTASGLDTQTSLHGGVIRYSLADSSQHITCAPGLTLVIGNSNVSAATSQVNARVRSWLAERSTRLHYFQEIGLLAGQAEIALRKGDWAELGHLLNLNQLILERIGVSCPELEALNEAALTAGALGAKLSGSGGGGIMLALATPDTVPAIEQAIRQAGGTAIVAPVAIPGVVIQKG